MIMRISPAPDFIIIGAMKSATTTLHEQLARQPGLWMSRPKEPNFFSDDENYARGPSWYASCFEGAGPDDLRGESSTHYTKLPTHPRTVERMLEALPRVKLIYVMRHPIDRLTSHYLHEQTVGRITVGLEQAVDRCPELVDYGRYGMQLEPYLRALRSRGDPSRLLRPPGRQARRGARSHRQIPRRLPAAAVGPLPQAAERRPRAPPRQPPAQRPRPGPRAHLAPTRLVPRSWAERAKAFWQVGTDPPRVSARLEQKLRDVFDRDLARLGSWLGIALDCDSFHSVAANRPLDWSHTAGEFARIGRVRDDEMPDRPGMRDLRTPARRRLDGGHRGCDDRRPAPRGGGMTARHCSTIATGEIRRERSR